MKTTLVAILVLATSLHAQEKAPPVPPKVKADKRLEFLKSLAGSWTVSGEKAGPMKGRTNTWSVMAGGSAVMERIFVGTEEEMLTVYHVDGKKLVATHYCLMMNAPRLKAHKKMKDGTLTFDCTGVANVKLVAS